MTSSLSRRTFLRTFALATGGVLLAACQPKVVEVEKVIKETVEVEKVVKETVEVEKQVEKVVTAVPTPMGPVTINLFARSGDFDVMRPQVELSGFAEKYPEVTIEWLGVPDEQEYLTKLLTMAAGGRMGSVFWASIGLCNFQRFAIKGMMIDLMPLIEAEGFDVEDFYPKALEPLTFEGNKLYGLPWRVHPGVGGLVYNVDLFEEAGVPEPEDGWTWEDLVTAGQALTKDTTGDGRTDQWGYVLGRQDYLGYVLFIRAQDGWEITEDGKTSLLNSPEALTGFEWLWDTYYTWRIQPPAASIEKSIGDMFLNGKIAMQQTGMWGQIQAHQIEEDGKFAVGGVPLPRSPKGQRPSLFEVDSVSIASMLREELVPYAWELLKATVTTEAAAYETHYCCSGGRMSGFELAKQQKDLHPSVLPYYPVLDECMEYRTAWNYRSSEYDTTVKAELDPLWLGNAEPTQDFLDEVATRVQEVLDLPMAT